MNYKAICTDIDGTLLDSNKELSSKTISVIKALPKEVPVILASSRMPSAMTHIQSLLNLTDHPLICYNGGYVIQPKGKAVKPIVFESTVIPATTCLGIVSLATGTNIHVSLYTEDDWYAPAYDKWTEREERITKTLAMVTSVDRVLQSWIAANKGAHKVMCMGPEHEIEELATLLNHKFSEDIHVYYSRPTYLELAPRSITKASGLVTILKSKYEIEPEDVIAFGDNYNDIELLRTVGLGVAVANAKEEVKAIAKEITLNSIDDGVAIAIEKYFNL